ncbi:hypothetical protein [Natronoglomus mannanivorans]|uniref:Uncharacterized protein n=1 Tax=Natronoglomus mannanivorans TaxID=2979990 RepID=A0AAP3E4C2_9EURY|nr:hypothetical protein [Halobacteria archaeon AArc-xg1-1]
MYDDDSRGLESPDRPHASTDDWNTRARPDGGDPSSNESTEPAHPNDVDPDAASYRLEVIDHQAKRLLEELVADRTDRGRPHEAVRHLREIRAEVEWVRRGLCECPETSTAESTGDSGERTDDAADTPNEHTDSTDDEARSTDTKGVTDDGVPMVVRRGPHVTTVLGPEPAAYERWLEAEDSESDNSNSEDGDPDVEDADGDDGGDRDAE